MLPFRAALATVVLVFFAHADPIQPVIDEAGATVSDSRRLEILKTLTGRANLGSDDTSDLDKTIAEIERWISDPRLYYFDRPFLKNELYTFELSEDSPFRPIEALYQARMFLWVTLEYGGYWSDPEARRERLAQSRRMFEEVAASFPDSALVNMYLGTPIPPDRELDVPNDPPEWVVHQREGLERLADIITWWIDNRQRDDGQFGGGWGDDCEMWRWWVPVLIGFHDPKIAAAQARLSHGLFAQEHMQGGYTNHVFDVEHTAEDSADTITPMMHLEPENPQWRDRALRLTELMESLWTGHNDRGQRQFKSTYFSVDTIDPDPRKACDTVYHPRAVQPALLYWQRTGDHDLDSLFTDWLDTWVDAAAREERGKPAGVIPSAIHWPDGAVGGTGPEWWDPQNHSDDPLYVFPSAMGSMTNTLLLAYHMTRDETYLAPLRSMAAIRMQYLESPPANPDPGSAMWCASKIGSLAETLAKYRLLTGATEFDVLLARENSPYLKFRLSGDVAPLAAALSHNANALRVNFPGFTSEVRYTDRVLRLPSIFGNLGLGLDPGLLYSTATGDPGNAGYFPMNAVRWLTPPRDIAALVTNSGQDEFEARLYHFGDEPRTMDAELYLLNPGDYHLSLETSDGSVITESPLTVNTTATRIHFELPAQKECILSVRQ